MRVLELDQNTPEWEEYRRTHIGASDAPSICGIDPYMNAYAKWKEKAGLSKRYETEAMRLGKELEPHARFIAQDHFGMEFPPLCILHDSLGFAMASLDGYNHLHSRALELKVVGQKTFDKISADGPLPSWIYQMNHQMECIDAHYDMMHLVVLNRDTMKFLPYTQYRDQEIVSELLEKEAEFFQRMINFDPPEDSHVLRTDPAWQALAQAFLLSKQKVKSAEEEQELCRKALIAASDSVSTKGEGVTVTRYMSKGTVDYKLVPELQGVDLNPYRKAGKEAWRVA